MTTLERIAEKIVRDHDVLQARLAVGRVVLTKGVYDLLHAGHLRSFAHARDLGDTLVVAVSSDRAVRRRKGPTRPIIPEQDRLLMVAAVQCVDWVTVYDDVSPFHVLDALRPAVFAASHFESISPAERAELEKYIEFVDLPRRGGQSTTDIVNALLRSHEPKD